MVKRLAGIALTLLGGAAAVTFFSRRAIGRFETIDLDEVQLPGRHEKIDGVRVHVIEQGNGFPVLLIHGFGGSTYDFRTLIPALAERFRVIAVDLPGFGFSDRDAPELSGPAWVEMLRALLQRLGVERAIVIGHSMGGMVAQRFAAEHPKMVERLVLIASPRADQRPPFRADSRVASALLACLQGLTYGLGGITRVARRTVADPALMSGEALEEHLRPLRVRGSAAAVRQLVRDAAREEPVDLARVTTPTLLLWGSEDRIVPLKVGEELRALLPNARLEVVQGAGHMVLEERPEETHQIVLRFLNEAVAAAAASTPGTPA
jgi:pimeloyl-ACP methyl ester carboxylesterase